MNNFISRLQFTFSQNDQKLFLYLNQRQRDALTARYKRSTERSHFRALKFTLKKACDKIRWHPGAWSKNRKCLLNPEACCTLTFALATQPTAPFQVTRSLCILYSFLSSIKIWLHHQSRKYLFSYISWLLAGFYKNWILQKILQPLFNERLITPWDTNSAV